jgi:hypothetical protein
LTDPLRPHVTGGTRQTAGGTGIARGPRGRTLAGVGLVDSAPETSQVVPVSTLRRGGQEDSFLKAEEALGIDANQDLRAELAAAARLLAFGLAFVFVYAAMSTFLNPSAFHSYLPTFLTGFEPGITDLILRAFAICEAGLAAGLLTRRYRYGASLLSAATLAGIVVINGDAFDVLFRNVGITFAAVALARLSDRNRADQMVHPPRRDVVGRRAGTNAVPGPVTSSPIEPDVMTSVHRADFRQKSQE